MQGEYGVGRFAERCDGFLGDVITVQVAVLLRPVLESIEVVTERREQLTAQLAVCQDCQIGFRPG